MRPAVKTAAGITCALMLIAGIAIGRATTRPDTPERRTAEAWAITDGIFNPNTKAPNYNQDDYWSQPMTRSDYAVIAWREAGSPTTPTPPQAAATTTTAPTEQTATPSPPLPTSTTPPPTTTTTTTTSTTPPPTTTTPTQTDTNGGRPTTTAATTTPTTTTPAPETTTTTTAEEWITVEWTSGGFTLSWECRAYHRYMVSHLATYWHRGNASDATQARPTMNGYQCSYTADFGYLLSGTSPKYEALNIQVTVNEYDINGNQSRVWSKQHPDYRG